MTSAALYDPAHDLGAEQIRAQIAWLEREGPIPDPRTDIDTASLTARFPRLRHVWTTPLIVPSPDAELRARVYHPVANGRGVGLVWIHGGGWIGGDIDRPEAHWVSLELAARGVAVVSLGYRKALHGVRAPQLEDDVLRGWHAGRDALRGLGISAEAVHLGGASAGAALSAGLSLRLRDDDNPAPASVILVYPLVHRELPPVTAEVAGSVRGLPTERVISPGAVSAYTANVLGGDAAARYLLPGDVPPLDGQSPILIIAAERDLLRGSSDRYAEQLRDAGVAVVSEVTANVVHGYLDDPGLPEASSSIDRMVRWMADRT
ncbi:alpha/beta hydrolase [Microbacterium gorillae]|uniref:alpha/beta hydrolase n=1 Tax=Microbacterium gorillae TaxID=1231063 RepID=UPI003D96146A